MRDKWAASVRIDYRKIQVPKLALRDLFINPRDGGVRREIAEFYIVDAVSSIEKMLAPHGGLKTLRVRANYYTLSVEFLGDTGNV